MPIFSVTQGSLTLEGLTFEAAVAAAQATAGVVRLTCDQPGPTKGEGRASRGERVEEKGRLNEMNEERSTSFLILFLTIFQRIFLCFFNFWLSLLEVLQIASEAVMSHFGY